MDWSEENLASYSAFLSRVVRDRGLLHFDRSAVARIVEHGARLRDHQRKLTARFLDIGRLAVEASHWAGKGAAQARAGGRCGRGDRSPGATAQSGRGADARGDRRRNGYD